MRPITPATLAAWIVIGLLAFGPPLNLPAIELPWNIGGQAAPFKTDKLSVLVIEETEDRAKLSSGQLDAMLGTAAGSVRDYVTKHGGEFRLIDKDADVSDEAAWVQEAFKVQRNGVPWIVAANSRRGFSVPLTPAPEVLKELEPLGGK